ncbi:MAG: class I SAM-dependent methyltransferase [Arcobacter butzleri]|nr:class I SAM-dependent methyltransferase [Arcobacteraceae bacterium]MDY0365293.1 class I SAM-dependent methyltransferase [Arcobacteraceae bacterium]NLO17424.1 class I SAM-dependent methyltransferase [Aliarcobacter butzleri]
MKSRYLQSCQTIFWQKVFKEEIKKLKELIKKEDKILSVGCGPAIIERTLKKEGYNIIGLDISKESLDRSADDFRVIEADAANMSKYFKNDRFDVVFYIASMQFIQEYEQAIKETYAILSRGGKVIIMLINPKSEFYYSKKADKNSYIQYIKHLEPQAILEELKKSFNNIKTEYFLGIDKEEMFISKDPSKAAIFLIEATKE